MGEMIEGVLAEQTAPLTRRLQRMVGDRETAEDLRQEAFVRAWRAAPRDGGPDAVRAWVHRTASNLALDELRRRRRQGALPLPPETALEAPAREEDGAAREALEALRPGERLVLLLRFEAGLSLREVAEVLEISEEAARKRASRARAAFAAALAAVRAQDMRPQVLLLLGHEEPAPYRAWLERAGARVRVLNAERPGLDLAGADALVLSGSERDLHPALYRERPGPHQRGLDLARDARDLAALRAALRADLPLVGVCRGTQLLNVLFGGGLHQHLPDEGYAEIDHATAPHAVGTAPGSLARQALGRAAGVLSGHHQAVRDLGRGLRVTARAADGLPEAVEVPGRRFALGVQWHPERPGPDDYASTRVADALVAAAAA